MPWTLPNRLAERWADSPTTEPTDRSTFRLMTTIVWPSASSAKTVVFARMNSTFCWLANRGWMLTVTATNTIRTTMMPDSLTRKTRSVRRRELLRGAPPSVSSGVATVALIVRAPAGRSPRT
jgi:hypothetical protein